MGTIMGKTIWKYPLALTDVQYLEIPGLVQFLPGVHDVRGDVCVYAMVDTTVTDAKKYAIRIVGTGHPADFTTGIHSYLGSKVFKDGQLVFHYFASMIPKEG